MGKVQDFQITFDQNKVVYSPGESISGTVTIQLGQALQCKGIKVNCNGFCGITSKVNDMAWTVEEQYFNSTTSVADKGTLKQGEHTFPSSFSYQISICHDMSPDVQSDVSSCQSYSTIYSAPTSFEGNYGRIIYRVRAFIDTPRFAKDYNTEKAFYLLSLLNLNEVPDIWGTCSSAVTQQFTYMLVKTGTVVLKAQTDKKGYTPGQIIQVMANIHNQSGKTTGNMAASLMQRVTYETKRPTYDVRMIAEVEGGMAKAGKEVEWKEQIIVPPLPQSSLAGCDLIKIEYYVKVCLKSPDVMLTLPIHIGNVSLDKKSAPPTCDAAEDTPASASTPDTSTPTLPSCPAPKPAPRPTPRSRVSFYNSPSAPPAEYHQGAEGGTMIDGFPNKRQSQLVSPKAFSYAPGLFFSQNQQHNGCSTVPSGPIGNESTGATSLYPPLDASSMPTPLSLPPDYGTSAYPQEAPPSYHESCNT